MLKGILSKEGRRERALLKAVERAGNAKIKPDDRRPALFTLLEDGSSQAVAGLLRRLTFNYDTNIVADEEEKNYVYEGLVSMGSAVLPELRTHLKTAPSLAWGLRLLREVCSSADVWEVVSEVARSYEPGYQRDPSKKHQLLAFLGDLEDERVPPLLVPFLDDHDETVRFVTIEALFKQRDENVAREPLLKLLASEDEESLRLKNRIADGFVEHGWLVKGYRGAVEKALPDEYVVDGKGRIKRKKGKA